MYRDLRISGQECLTGVGLVEDHSNLLSTWLSRHHGGEDRHDVSTGLAWPGLAQHFTTGNIQCDEQTNDTATSFSRV